jgi:hypothetical protein
LLDLITERVRDPADTMRQARDKVRKRILYAAERGELAGGPTGGFDVRAVAAWARVKWPGVLVGLQADYEDVTANQANLSDRAEAIVIPKSLERCQRLLAEAEAEIGRLQSELARVNAENFNLRPAAERMQQIRDKNRAAAKRPRKRR